MKSDLLGEIDALVAEHALGWGPVVFEHNGREYRQPPDGSGVSFTRPTPAFSSDIAAAWLVWERLRESRVYCCMDVRAPYAEDWEVALTRLRLEPDDGSGHRPDVIVRAETASLAICLAILRAHGIEVPDEAPGGAE